ncbi:MAG: hypothetical protein ACYTX0_46305, partial [Nostoc sp.]
AGNIRINSRGLFVKNGANISTFSDGQGNGGNIFIDTRDAVIIDGTSGNNTSGAFSFLSAGGVGKGGDIQITTNYLTLSNGGQLAATSFGKGNAGDIIVNAGDAIGIDGVGSNGSSSGVFTTLEGQAVGNGGNINLTTGSLFLNRGGISSSSLGQGKAGDININSGSTTLDNQAAIAAITNSGDGGNINLTANELLLLRRGSKISTTAGTAQS